MRCTIFSVCMIFFKNYAILMTRSSAFVVQLYISFPKKISFKIMSEHAVGAGAVIGSGSREQGEEESKERRQVQRFLS